jgi:hypothetical protein
MSARGSASASWSRSDPYMDKNYVQPFLDKGFTIVDKIDAPDGKYQYIGGGYRVCVI